MGLSVCMIIKDEAANILRAVESARKVADELVIVDTGSMDGTRKLLTGAGVAFHTAEWRDSFAEARNISMSLATQDWLFWMDADDVITDDCARRINALKAKPADSVFLFNVVNINTALNETVGRSNEFMQLRMFPNHKGLKFVNRVHEQVAGDALHTLNRGYAEDVVIEHYGYSNHAHQIESLRRNIRLQMIDIGFPANTDFFSFDIGENVYCIYHPKSLAIWYRHIYLGCIDPFRDDVPKSHEDRFALMKTETVRFLSTYIDGMRVAKAKDCEKMIADIEAAIDTGAFNVCPVA